MDTTTPNDSIAKRNVILLIILQASVGLMIPAHFTLGGIAGNAIAPLPVLATLPISMTIIGSMIATPINTRISVRKGRQISFFIATLVAAVGSTLAAFALFTNNFWLLNAGSLLIGFFMSAQGAFRFAATDMASENFRARAISFSLLGGIGAAIFGPGIVGAYSVPNIWLPYLITAGLAVVSSLLYFALKLPKPAPMRTTKINLKPILANPRVQAAMILSIVSYAMMNLMMTSTPLAVEGCGFAREDAAHVVRAHVLAMFIPSFFTGYLIKYFGIRKVVLAGLIIIILAAVVGLMGTTLIHFYVALILLGIGWNFGFIGGTNMLASAITDGTAAKQMQGLNDTIMWSLVAVASLSSGVLMNFIGDGAELGWRYVNYALIGALILAMALSLWKLKQADKLG